MSVLEETYSEDEATDYIQEDEDDSDEEHLQGIIEAQYSQFTAEKAERQEALKASRPWSAPPLMSPRPETQRAKKAEALAMGDPQTLSAALSLPRADYDPPAQRQGFSSSGMPEELSYLAAPRPLSAGHIKSQVSGVATGIPLQGIQEEGPMEDQGMASSKATAALLASFGGPHAGHLAQDSQGSLPAEEEASVADMVPDDELYEQVGDSVSQAASRGNTHGGHTDGEEEEKAQDDPEEEDVEEEEHLQPNLTTLAATPAAPAPAPTPEPIASPVRVPTTSLQATAKKDGLAPETSGVLSMFGGVAAQDAGAAPSVSNDSSTIPATAGSTVTDYGDLLHPHTFAVSLLQHDLHAPPPAPHEHNRKRTAAAPAADEPASKPWVPPGKVEPTLQTSDPTSSSAPTLPTKPSPVPGRICTSTEEKASPSKVEESMPKESKEESEEAFSTKADGQESTITDYGDLLHPHRFAMQLLSHDLAHVPEQMKGETAAEARARAREALLQLHSKQLEGVTGGQSPQAPLPVAPSRRTRGKRDPTARASAGMLAGRACGRPMSAPVQPVDLAGRPNATWAGHGQRSAYARRGGSYANPRQEQIPSAHLSTPMVGHQPNQQESPGGVALLSDDEAEVEVLNVGDEGLADIDEANEDVGHSGKQTTGKSAGNGGCVMSFAEWQRKFKGEGSSRGASDTGGSAQGDAQTAGAAWRKDGTWKRTSRPQTAPTGGRNASCARPAPAAAAGQHPGIAYVDEGPGWSYNTKTVAVGTPVEPAWAGSSGYPASDVLSSAWGASRQGYGARQRPASAHPLSRPQAAGGFNGASAGSPGTLSLADYPLCSTAAVDVAGHAGVSVYVADTLRKVNDANRCMALLGLSRRYRLKSRTSNMHLEVYDSNWTPLLSTGHATGVHLVEVEAQAPAIRQLSLSSFLTAYHRLKQQAVLVEAQDEDAAEQQKALLAAAISGIPNIPRGEAAARMYIAPAPTVAPIRRQRPKSAMATCNSGSSPYRPPSASRKTLTHTAQASAAWMKPRTSVTNYPAGQSGIPGIPLGGFVMHSARGGSGRLSGSGPQWAAWESDFANGRNAGSLGTDLIGTQPIMAAWGEAPAAVPGPQDFSQRNVIQELESALHTCEALSAKIGTMQRAQVKGNVA